MFPLDLSLHTVTGHKDKNLEEPLKLDFFVGKFPSVETFKLSYERYAQRIPRYLLLPMKDLTIKVSLEVLVKCQSFASVTGAV